MAEDLGRAELELATDQSGLNKGIDEAERKTRGWLDGVKRGIRDAFQRGSFGGFFQDLAHGRSLVSSLRDGLKGLRPAIAQGLGIGAGISVFNALRDVVGSVKDAVVDFVRSSVDAASDLNETLSKSEVIFGRNADGIEEWAETADRAMGQSKRAAIDTASTFAGLFQTVEIGGDKAAGMAKKLTGLGSDLASFFNTDVQSALDAIRSGLSGESEPLRRYNVFLSETAVKAKAAAMGLKPVGGELSEQQKILARYQIILDQTTTAQGDFARTADGQANAARSLTAEMENLSAEVGEELLPVIRDATIFLRDEAVPALRDLVQTAKDAGPVIDALAFGFQALQLTAQGSSGAQLILERQVEATAKALEESRRGFAAYRSGERTVGDASKAMAADIRSVGTQAGRAADRVETSLDEIVSSFRRHRQELATLASEAASAIYDPIIRAGELAATEREIAEQRQIIASRNSTKEQVADAKQRMAELQKRRRELLGELAGFGKNLDQTLAQANADLQRAIREGNKEAIAALTRYRRQLQLLRLDAIAATGALRGLNSASGMYGHGGRQAGGPVEAGQAVWVGEAGRELIVPRVSSYVLPHGLSEAIARLQPRGVEMRSSQAEPTIDSHDTYHITAAPSAVEPFALARELQRFGEMGTLTPRLRPVLRPAKV